MMAANNAGTRRAIAQSLAWLYEPGPEPHREEDALGAIDDDSRVVLEGVSALERAVLDTPPVQGIVLRYGLLYGPGTSNEQAQDPCSVHVQAAAHAAHLAIERGRPGAYNVADDNAFVSTEKARRELGWDPAFRRTTRPTRRSAPSDQMEDEMASTQSEVRALLDSQSKAIRIKDIDRLMSLYSPDIIYFDVVPPLQYAGSAALRGRFLEWFDGYKGSIRFETRDLNILATGDIAVAHWLGRASGTLKNGREVGSWVRATSCCQRLNHRWLITHEHISLPVDLKSGSAAMDVAP